MIKAARGMANAVGGGASMLSAAGVGAGGAAVAATGAIASGAALGLTAGKLFGDYTEATSKGIWGHDKWGNDRSAFDAAADSGRDAEGWTRDTFGLAEDNPLATVAGATTAGVMSIVNPFRNLFYRATGMRPDHVDPPLAFDTTGKSQTPPDAE